MRKAKLVIGQDIYALTEGTRVESVRDVLVDGSEDRVVGLLVETGGLLGTSKVVPMGAVTAFGPSAVMIRTTESVVPAASDPGVSQVLTRGGSLTGNRVVTEDGTHLGSIADLYFDERTAAILGYEVTGGTHCDLMGGSLYLPIDEVQAVGRDAVIVSTSVLETLRSRQAPASLPEQDAEATDAASPDAPDRASTDSPDARTALVGARLRADLTDADGSVVAANGAIVTPELVARAEAEGNLEPLLAATGMGHVTPAGEQMVAEATATAADLWSRFTTRLAEVTDGAGQRLDAQQTRARLDRINDAIGRPVTKVFLDRDDSVILDLGDLVTHQAVQRAADAGLLDSLLGSVYEGGDITFTRDEMRAGVSGHSTLDQASGGASVVTELEKHLHAVDGSSAAATDDASSAPEADDSSTTPDADQGDRRPAEQPRATLPEANQSERPSRSSKGRREPAPGQTIGQRPDPTPVSR